MADLRIDLAAEFRGKKAFQEADKSVSSLDKAVGKLGKRIASVFAAQKIAAFGKASLKAFADDQAAATRLAKTVDNLGLSFANPAIDQFIKKLEMQSGIVDETLRPAFQALLTTTGDVSKSMTLLKNAVDISRGSGVDLATVTQDLANGYVGITRGLKKYNLGLSQAQLKSKSFTEIMGLLNKQFSGASAAYLDTYAGKMDIFNTAADNAKETIGKGLVDALTILGGQDQGVQKVADAMNNLATYTANAAVGAADLIRQLGQISGVSGLGEFIKGAFLALPPLQALSALANRGKSVRATGYGDYAGSTVDYRRQQDEKAAAKAKLLADQKAAELAKRNLANQKALTAEQKKQAALKKDGTIFDMQQIELVAALKGKLSDEERKRAELQLAILNGNVDAANQLSKEVLMAQDATGQLYQYFMSIGDLKIKNPFEFLDTWLKNFQDKLNNLQAPNFQSGTSVNLTPNLFTQSSPASPYQFPSTVLGGITLPSTNASVSMPSDSAVSYNQQTGLSYNPNNIQIQVTGEGTLTKAIADALQVQSLSGIPSSIQRLVSTFG